MDDDFLNCDDLPPTTLTSATTPSHATTTPLALSSTTSPKYSSSPNNLSIEDELDSIFSLSPTDKISSSGLDFDVSSGSGGGGGISIADVSTSLALNNDDFLAWLSDEPASGSDKAQNSSNANTITEGAKLSTTTSINIPTQYSTLPLSLPSLSSSHTSSSYSSYSSVPSAMSPGAMDSLIDELFDVSGTSSSSSSLPSLSSSYAPAHVHNNSSSISNSLRDLNAEIREALNSNFVDSYSLRSLIQEAGYIPEKDRCKIWNILINGLVSEDMESLTFKPADKSISSYSNLLHDCSDLIGHYSKGDFSGGSRASPVVDFETLRSDVVDILVLYLMRRGMVYSKFLVPFVIVVLFSSNRHAVPRSLASSCFYSYANAYQPLLQLDPSSYDVSIDTLHFYTRLLVSYHHPKLALHLDQIFPGWEQSNIPFEFPSSLSEEKESTAPIPSNSTHSNNSSNHNSQSSHARRALSKVGFVSNEWLVGCFLSVLPLDIGVMIMDWIIFNEERFAGLYLTVALLYIFGDSLLEMDRAGITAWQKDVDLGVLKWKHNSSITFDKSPSPKHKNKNQTPIFTSLSTGITEVKDLKIFVVGWLYATSALREKTPAALKHALNGLDNWSKTIVSRLRSLNKNTSNSSSNSEASGTWSKPKSSLATYSIESDDEDEVEQGLSRDGTNDAQLLSSSAQQNQLLKYYGKDVNSADLDASRDRADLMMQFKQLSMSFHNENPAVIGGENSSLDSSSNSSNNSNNKVHIQDYEREGVSLCLWSDAAEVVPCIASHKKRIGSPKPVMHYFLTGVMNVIESTKVKSNLFSYLPTSINMSSDLPFFFGIDCRTESEKSMGLFPKTYSLDPGLLTDSDHVHQLLDTLEPLSGSVHLCIFGAGESYIRWKLQKDQNDEKLQQVVKAIKSSLNEQSSQQQNQNTIDTLWRDERSKLNSVAMFFMKKGFGQVSILEGGFSAAVKHLYNHQSNTTGGGLNTSLVEADLPSIYSILGVVDMMPSMKQVGKGVDPNSTSSSNSLASSFSSYTQAASSYIKPFISGSGSVDFATSADNGSASNNSVPSSSNSNNNSNSNNSNNSDIQPTTAKLSSYMSSWGGMASSFIKSSVSGFPGYETTDTNKSASSTNSSITSPPSQPNNDSSSNSSSNSNSSTSNGRYSDIVAPENIEKGKAAIAEVSKRLSIFGSVSLETLKKGISSVSTAVSTSADAPPTSSPSQSSETNSLAHIRSQSDASKLDKNSTAFVIDDEGDDNDEASAAPGGGNAGDGSAASPDTKISIHRSDFEKQQVLINHRLAGLRKGDEVTINREYLPGAVLFPCMKLKEKKEDDKTFEGVASGEGGGSGEAPAQDAASSVAANVGGDLPATTATSSSSNTSSTTADADPVANNPETIKSPEIDLVHRYLVVTKERFMVLDANGGGVGAKAVVKSNHHLTELIKMTFRKKDPELVTVFFVHNQGANKTHQYRVPKKQQFVEILQKNMQKFKD